MKERFEGRGGELERGRQGEGETRRGGDKERGRPGEIGSKALRII
jgi:hypothetical protein